MRRARFGRCARRDGGAARLGESMDSAEPEGVRDSEADLDRLSSREPVDTSDPTLELLAALAEDVDDANGSPSPLGDAAGAGQDPAERAADRDVPAPGSRRRRSQMALTVGVVVVVASGTSVAAAAAMPGGVGPLRSLPAAVRALAGLETGSMTSADTPDESASSVRSRRAGGPADVVADTRALLEKADDALAMGLLRQARQALEAARRNLSTMDGRATESLAEDLQRLQGRLADAREHDSGWDLIAGDSESPDDEYVGSASTTGHGDSGRDNDQNGSPVVAAATGGKDVTGGVPHTEKSLRPGDSGDVTPSTSGTSPTPTDVASVTPEPSTGTSPTPSDSESPRRDGEETDRADGEHPSSGEGDKGDPSRGSQDATKGTSGGQEDMVPTEPAPTDSATDSVSPTRGTGGGAGEQPEGTRTSSAEPTVEETSGDPSHSPSSLSMTPST